MPQLPSLALNERGSLSTQTRWPSSQVVRLKLNLPLRTVRPSLERHPFLEGCSAADLKQSGSGPGQWKDLMVGNRGRCLGLIKSRMKDRGRVVNCRNEKVALLLLMQAKCRCASNDLRFT